MKKEYYEKVIEFVKKFENLIKFVIHQKMDSKTIENNIFLKL
jgi:hypothetical protein